MKGRDVAQLVEASEVETVLPLRGPGGTGAVARILRCESSEDGDGAAVRFLINHSTCSRHDLLRFACGVEKEE